MTADDQCYHVLCVEELDEDSRLHAVLAESAYDISSVSPDDAGGSIAVDGPDCVVVGTDDPSTTREVLESIRTRDRTIPLVVAPVDGSQALATVAVRENATDYVPLSNGSAEALERLAAVLEEDQVTESVAEGTLETGDQFLQLLADTLPDEAFVIDERGQYLDARIRPDSGELHTLTPDELVGRTLHDAFPETVADDMCSCIREALSTDEGQSIVYEAETTDGIRSFEGRVHPVDERIYGQRAVVWLARDITALARRERRLSQRRDHLETLNGINAVVRQVIHTLVEAPTRTDIERDVCHCLVESDLYCGSWIGEVTGPESISFQVSAGEAERYLDAVRQSDGKRDFETLDVVRNGEILATNRLQEAESSSEQVRAAAKADGVRSALAVPISHQETTYGVLTVLAKRVDAFGDREQSAFGLLGETIGFAISAVMNRRLLFADTVVELELRIGSADSFSFDLTDAYDCTVSFEWGGTTTEGYVLQYISVDGLDGDTVLGAADAHESVGHCRLVHDEGDACTLELKLTESGVGTLVNFGATIEEVVVEDGSAIALVIVPRDVDVRQLLDALRAIYERTELVARRELDRGVITAEERRNRIFDRLTERQLTALRLAYYGGYFDWPRGSTGEDIADAMAISPPTMHQHLRLAQRELLSEFFDERA